jgi:Zn-dependent peptidase ImmA (M78 family)
MKYVKTNLEEWIEDQYREMSLYFPRDITFEVIANYFNIHFAFGRGPSFNTVVDNFAAISVDCRESEIEQKQQFFHELCHALLHPGLQTEMSQSFKSLQESKADNFSYHCCIPTFMLLRYEIANFLDVEAGVPFIEREFGVTEEFARERLRQFKRKILQAKSDEEHRKYMESMYPKAGPYSEETNATLDKLQQIINKRIGVHQ